MAFPSTLYVYKEDGSQTKITGALGFSRKRVLFSDNVYRDSFSAAFMGAAIPNLQAPGISGAHLTAASVVNKMYTTLVPASVGGSGVNDPAEFSLSDEIAHAQQRVKQVVRWLWEFWDAATVGDAMTISVTTVSGSPTITVPNAEKLTPGQGISGLGITAGSIILSILDISASSGLPNLTSVLISQNATASATVAATLTGANRLGHHFEDEAVDWGGEISFPT